MPQTCPIHVHTHKRSQASRALTQSHIHTNCSMPPGSPHSALAQGHKCDVVYFDVYPNSRLEEYSKEYSRLLESHGEEPLSVRRLETVEDVLKQSDVSAVDRCYMTA